MKVASATVLICTYNRAAFLREAMTALATMRLPSNCAVQIVVVDNNSTDDTRQVIDDARRTCPVDVDYVFEGHQGKSFALNTGLGIACGDVIALTDDDVVPDGEWLARIVEAFRKRELTFCFGKVLPRWHCLPPAELLTERAREIWGPLAIVDYGDEAADYTADAYQRRLPIGANLAFLRSALLAVGGWRTDLGKVNNSLISGEDHEIFYRLRGAGLYRGFYDPGIQVRHHVPLSRLSRRYFRRWFYWHGKTLARMADEIYAPLDLNQVPHIARVPRFLYRQALQQFWRWLRLVGNSNALDVLIEELQAIEYVGFFTERWRPRTAPPPTAAAGTLAG